MLSFGLPSVQGSAEKRELRTLRIATLADSTRRAWALGIHPTSHELCLIAYDGNGTDNAIAQSPSLSRHAGEWIHVAGTYDGSAGDAALKVYVNGSHATYKTTPGAFRTLDEGPKTLYIGVFWNASGQLTGGYGDIDDVRLYNRTLTPEELAALADVGAGE